MAVTLFTWGYWGWGNATGQFVAHADAVEADRGFAAPLFVDTRIRRSVRAKGFDGNAFGALLGGRYRWMQGLGNECILSGEPGIRIRTPNDAGALLDLVLADPRRHVLFFCSCEWPAECHRRTVADLVMDEAKRREEDVSIIEWPGGEATRRTLAVPASVLAQVRRGRRGVPLDADMPEAGLRGLAWGSVLELEAGADRLAVLSGPPTYAAGRWGLPVVDVLTDERGAQEEASRAFRGRKGLEGRRTDPTRTS